MTGLIGGRAWPRDIACLAASGVDFFPVGDEHAAPALELCAVCPQATRQQCLKRAEPFGVWGGTTERERRAADPKFAKHRRPCRTCGELLLPAPGETVTQFARRRTCVPICTRQPLTLQQIADLLHGGATMRQVATAMSMSTSTLEQHLLRMGRSDLILTVLQRIAHKRAAA